MAAATPWRTPATTHGRYRLGSGTRTSSTQCVTPSWLLIGLGTSGDNRRSPRAALTAPAKGRPKKEGPRGIFTCIHAHCCDQPERARGASFNHLGGAGEQAPSSADVGCTHDAVLALGCECHKHRAALVLISVGMSSVRPANRWPP